MSDRFGPYELIEPLGEGAMGVVFLAHDPRLGRRVALKRIRPDALHESTRARFDEEIRAAIQLRHPGIVRVFEVGRVEGQPYYTMELVIGRPLDQVLAEERLGPVAAARLVLEVARALEHAHGQMIIHRDVKPSNLLVDDGYNPHLLDFGLARRMTDEAGLTKTGMIVGTPQFLAPEQMDPDFGDVGPVTDVYGLGGLLYFCLTGEPPNAGEREVEIFYRLSTEGPPSPRRVDPRVPARLDAICRRALARETRDRFQSAVEMAEALDVFLRREAGVPGTRPALFHDPVHWAALATVLVGLILVAAFVFATDDSVGLEEEIQARRLELDRAIGEEDVEISLGAIAVLEALGVDVAAEGRQVDTLWRERRLEVGRELLQDARQRLEEGDEPRALAIVGLVREIDPSFEAEAMEIQSLARGVGGGPLVGGPEGMDLVNYRGWRYRPEELRVLGLVEVGGEWLDWPDLVGRGFAAPEDVTPRQPTPLRFRLDLDGGIEWVDR